MGPITGLLIASIIGALASAGAGVYSAKKNYDATVNTNNQNISMQQATNAQNQYNIEHAHQIEMADLQAAGLNPVLTATGGNGAPIQALNSPKAVAPQVDTSQISSALSGISNMATMAMMMQMRGEISQAHNDTITAIAKGNNATSAANAVLRNQTLDKLYQRKAATLSREGSANIGSAKAVKAAKEKWTKTDEKEFQKLMKFFS